MVNKIGSTALGILAFIFGMVATYYTWDMLYGFYGLLNSTLLRIIWLGSVLIVWLSNVILVPYLLVTGGSGASIKGSLKGLLVWIIASFCAYLSYYIVPPIIDTLNGITGFGDLSIVGNMMWFGLVLFWIIGLMVYPVFLILKGGTKSNETDE